MSGDLYYNEVVLSLHGDGSNGSTTFTDTSGTPKTMTPTGTAAISTAQFKFGGASMHFPGSGAYLSTPTNTAFNFGTGDFTIEMWIYLPSLAADNYLVNRKNLAGAPTTGDWAVKIDATTGKLNFYTTTDNQFTFAGGNITVNTWHHIAVVRASNIVTGYIDGVQSTNSITISTSLTNTRTLEIGRWDTVPNVMTGWIDDLRLTVGVARYTSQSFTLPVVTFDDSQQIALGEFVGVAPSPTLAFFGGMRAALLAPSPVLVARGGGFATLKAPSSRIFGYFGGRAVLRGPSAKASASGHDATGERAFYGVAPKPVLRAFGGASAHLRAPQPKVVASATSTAVGRAALTAPRPVLTARGTGGGLGRATLQAPTARVFGHFGGKFAGVAPSAKTAGSATAGALGEAILRAPSPVLVARATAQNHGSAHLIAPAARLLVGGRAHLVAPRAVVVAAAHAVFTALYEAYALNLRHHLQPNEVVNDEMTRYTNFPFLRIVRFGNDYFGMAADGLYRLGGTTDYGAPAKPIAWSWKTGITDFKEPREKRVLYAYVGGRLGPAATVTIAAGERTPEVYNYTTPRGSTAQNYRQPFGRGIKARYFAFGMSGSDELAIDNMEFDVVTTSRRI